MTTRPACQWFLPNAGRRLPVEAAAVLLRGGAAAGDPALAWLGPDCLPPRNASLPGVIVPDPQGPSRRERLARALPGAGVLVGPAVPPVQFLISAHLAEVAARTQGAADLDGVPVVLADYVDALIVHRDPQPLSAPRGGARHTPSASRGETTGNGPVPVRRGTG